MYDADAVNVIDWEVSVSGGDTVTFPNFTYDPISSFRYNVGSIDGKGIGLPLLKEALPESGHASPARDAATSRVRAGFVRELSQGC